MAETPGESRQHLIDRATRAASIHPTLARSMINHEFEGDVTESARQLQAEISFEVGTNTLEDIPGLTSHKSGGLRFPIDALLAFFEGLAPDVERAERLSCIARTLIREPNFKPLGLETMGVANRMLPDGAAWEGYEGEAASYRLDTA